MPDRGSVGAGYAYARLNRALERAAAGDVTAGEAVERWRAVLAGMADGTLRIGSRTPVVDLPAWVTLQVVHGGFATGAALAEMPLDAAEATIVHALPPTAPGRTDRERLNLWYLTDDGQDLLLAMLVGRAPLVVLPEDAALPTVAWLLAHDHHGAALDLVSTLRPMLPRLRLAPSPTPVSPTAVSPAVVPSSTEPADLDRALVHLAGVGDVRERLRAVTTSPAIATQRRVLADGMPLYDRLVELWCDTVQGELPQLVDGAVVGGWPCRVWPADWSERRSRWLAEHARRCGADLRWHPRSNAARLHRALLACGTDAAALTGRDVGWIRRALANTITAHGAPGSARRTALRDDQRRVVERPTHAAMAGALVDRVADLPHDAGLPTVSPIVADTTRDVGEPVPAHLAAILARALRAPVADLVDRGVIGSSEVLAGVLPQAVAPLIADVPDPDLAALVAADYRAFRRRRGLLLLRLQHQVRFAELPWIAAIEPLRTGADGTASAARNALAQAVLLAVRSFPATATPNPLVREFSALAEQAGLRLPLVEEVAADIFTGTFTAKWRAAAVVATSRYADTLYGRYYDLPEDWSQPPAVVRRRGWRSWRVRGDDAFASVCIRRAAEQTGARLGPVAGNGAIIEQAQILTTHNLAVLVDALDLTSALATTAASTADRALGRAVALLGAAPRGSDSTAWHAGLVAAKNAAYAWRQAVFLLSLADLDAQRAAVDGLRAAVGRAGAGPVRRLGPMVDGLAHVVEGGRFGADGTTPTGATRLLGWSVGPHPLLVDRPPTARR